MDVFNRIHILNPDILNSYDTLDKICTYNSVRQRKQRVCVVCIMYLVPTTYTKAKNGNI